MTEPEEVEHALVLAFDSDDPESTRGFEAGILWQRTEHEAGLAPPPSMQPTPRW